MEDQLVISRKDWENLRLEITSQKDIEDVLSVMDDFEIKLLSQLKTDDIVRIKKDSFYYRDGDKFNPKDMIGEVTMFNESKSDHIVYVKWENGFSNRYRIEDLEKYAT